MLPYQRAGIINLQTNSTLSSFICLESYPVIWITCGSFQGRKWVTFTRLYSGLSTSFREKVKRERDRRGYKVWNAVGPCAFKLKRNPWCCSEQWDSEPHSPRCVSYIRQMQHFGLFPPNAWQMRGNGLLVSMTVKASSVMTGPEPLIVFALK